MLASIFLNPFDQLLTQFLDHLRYERNVSAHTLRNYESDLQQFFDYLAPIENEAAAKPAAKHSSRAEGKAPDIKQIDHLTIREWLSTLHSDKRRRHRSPESSPRCAPSFSFWCAKASSN